MLELYHTGGSVCSQKVRLALAEKNLEWVDHPIDLSKDEHLQPEYVALNPNGVVPTLIHDGRVVIESCVINEYLDTVFREPPLSMSDAYDQACLRVWTKQPDDSIHVAVAVISACTYLRVRHLGKTPEELEARLARVPVRARRDRLRRAIELGADAPEFEEAILRFDKLFGDMEAALSGNSWLMGSDFTLADLDFIPYVTSIEKLQFGGMWADRPGVTAWIAAIKARPSYATAMTAWDSEAADKMMTERGHEAWPKVEAILANE